MKKEDILPPTDRPVWMLIILDAPQNSGVRYHPHWFDSEEKWEQAIKLALLEGELSRPGSTIR